MKFNRFEISLAVGLLAALLWCAFTEPRVTMRWWCVAFEPLCDGVLTAESGGEEIVYRSFFAEALGRLFA